MRCLIFWGVLGVFFSCQGPQLKQEPLAGHASDRVLADIYKIDVPVIEKKTRKIVVPVEALRPSLAYGAEEVEIKKSETGYELRLWLLKSPLPAQSLAFKKAFIFQIPLAGGHDIEVIGQRQSFIELIFIDEQD